MKKHSISLKTIRTKSPSFRLRGAALLSAALCALPLASCDHRLLLYGLDGTRGQHRLPSARLHVAFDWSAAPEAAPPGMSVYFYPLSGGEEPYRFDFPGREGGPVELPYGTYRALCLNDGTERIHLRGEEGLESFEIYGEEASLLEGMGMAASPGAGLPDGMDTGESVISSPDEVWTDLTGELPVGPDSAGDTVWLAPTGGMTRVSYDIAHVSNLSGVSMMSGSLSGMAGSYFPGRGEPSATRVTVPFESRRAGDRITGSFLTFGLPGHDDGQGAHAFTVYTVLADGSRFWKSLDPEEVERQIREQSESRHIHIRIDSLTLPQVQGGGGGLQPEVDEWENAGEVVLPM